MHFGTIVQKQTGPFFEKVLQLVEPSTDGSMFNLFNLFISTLFHL